MDSETRCLLLQAADEIRRLRQDNQVLNAVSETVKAFSMALAAYPPSQGAGPDIVWHLERAANPCEERAKEPETNGE